MKPIITPDPSFPDACRTGRLFVTPYCTAGVFEFRIGSTLYLASHAAGHGWSAAWPGCIEGIIDEGTVIEADGTERPIRWQGDREGRCDGVRERASGPA